MPHAMYARADPTSVVEARSAHAVEGARTGDLLKIALRLRAMTRDDGSIDAAQVRVIGLDDIREAAGTRWPRMRENVRRGSLAILTRHAEPADVIIPAGDGFLVVLGEGSPGANQARCQVMRDALLQFYLGEEALQSLRPEVTSRSVTADGFADLLVAQTNDGNARSEARSAPDLISMPVCLANDAQIVAAVLGPGQGAPGGARLAYNRDFILDGRHGDVDFLETDIDVVAGAVEMFAHNDPNTAYGFTVHATTLQRRRSREIYLAAVHAAIDNRQAPSFITIAEIEKGTPLISIGEWCVALRPLTAKVGLDFHYTDLAITSIGGSGAWAAGFHLPVNAHAQSEARGKRMLEQIQFWSRRLRPQGLRFAVNGFRSRLFLIEAAKLGVDLAAGTCLGPVQAVSTNGAQPVI